jgi:hypothetical protein
MAALTRGVCIISGIERREVEVTTSTKAARAPPGKGRPRRPVTPAKDREPNGRGQAIPTQQITSIHANRA